MQNETHRLMSYSVEVEQTFVSDFWSSLSLPSLHEVLLLPKSVCVYIYRYIKQFISVRQSYGHTSASARWGTDLGPANQPFWSFEHSPSAPELRECDSITSALLSSLISCMYLLLTQPYIYLIKHRDLFLNLDFPSSCFPPLETSFFFSNPGKTSQ